MKDAETLPGPAATVGVAAPIQSWPTYLREWADGERTIGRDEAPGVLRQCATEMERLQALAGPQWDLAPLDHKPTLTPGQVADAIRVTMLHPKMSRNVSELLGSIADAVEALPSPR